MKKILFVITSLCGGGAEKVLVDLLNVIDKDVYDIDLLVVRGGIFEERLNKKINYRKIINVRNKKVEKLVFKLIRHIPIFLFRKLFIREHYDVEIAYLEGYPTSIVAKGNNKKIAFVHCDVSVRPVLQKYYNSYAKCIAEYNKFEKVCFVSKKAKEQFEKVYGTLSNGCVVHNVIDYEDIEKRVSEESSEIYSTKGLRIISIGRLVEQKAFDRLINVAKKLEENYDFEICILGEGEKRSALEQQIKEKNVSSVNLVGFKDNPYPYIKQADLYVCSSLFEGYSTTVTESLFLGVPVLTTRCAGMGELLNSGEYGFIVENSVDGLQEGLKNILEDIQILYEKKEKIKARKVCNEKQLEQYYRLFE